MSLFFVYSRILTLMSKGHLFRKIDWVVKICYNVKQIFTQGFGTFFFVHANY